MFSKRKNPDNYQLRFTFREVDLTGITDPIIIREIKPDFSYPYFIKSLYIQFFSDNANPSAFVIPNIKMSVPSILDMVFIPDKTSVQLIANPGLMDRTALAGRPKEFAFAPISIKEIINASDSIKLEISDFSPTNTLFRFMFLGYFIRESREW